MSDDDNPDSGYQREISDARAHAIHSLHEFDLKKMSPSQDVRKDAHTKLQFALNRYLALLYPYIVDEDVFEEDIVDPEENEVTTLEGFVESPGKVETDTVDDGDALNPEKTKTITRTSLHSPKFLRKALFRLNEVALEQGFLPEKRTKKPSNDPDLGDLRGLLTERGQHSAAEQLPALRDD